MRRRLFATFASLLLIRGIALAGGPLTVTGPAALQPGQPFVWPSGSPIHYTVDTGPLSVNPSGQTVITKMIGFCAPALQLPLTILKS
jgi:hypothetical protein